MTIRSIKSTLTSMLSYVSHPPSRKIPLRANEKAFHIVLLHKSNISVDNYLRILPVWIRGYFHGDEILELLLQPDHEGGARRNAVAIEPGILSENKYLYISYDRIKIRFFSEE